MSRVTNAPRDASGCAWPTHTQPPRKRCSASQAATSLVDVGAGRELGGLEQRAPGLRQLGRGEGRRHGGGIYQDFVRLTTWSGSRRLAAMTDYDAIVVGGGHNGLTAGATSRGPGCASAWSSAATSSEGPV